MEMEHEQAIFNLQDQLRISKSELEEVKHRLEERTSSSPSIGIGENSSRENIHAWNVVSAHQQGGEVNIHFILTSLIKTNFQGQFNRSFFSLVYLIKERPYRILCSFAE